MLAWPQLNNGKVYDISSIVKLFLKKSYPNNQKS